jgi:hypothetical protein
MIVFYTLLLVFLGVAKFLIGLRAAALARKYSRVTKEATALLHHSNFKEGNSSKTADPYNAARRQYLLGGLIQRKERLEGRHFAWQSWADWLSRAVANLRSWRGRKLPYTAGVVDLGMLLYAIDALGVGNYVSVQALIELVRSWISG